VPSRGQLQRQGTTLTAGSAFIQQDITDGKIAYAHDGSEEASDSFTFTVADPAGNQTAEHAFSITITPMNDAPTVLSPLSDVFVELDASDTLIALAGVFAEVDPGDILSYSVTVAHTTDSVVNDIRESSYKRFGEDHLYTHLADNRVFGPQHDLARENIASYFAGLGLPTVLEPFQYNNQTYYNVVATKIGAVRPNDVYLVGAH
jgi:VCBS repeat-containing protein